jgi:hypothetical protein
LAIIPSLSNEQLLSELAELRVAAAAKAAARAAGKVDPFDLASEDYEKYLRSALWRRIKKRVLTRDGGWCLCCGGKGTVVHHRSYAPEVMRGEDDEQLATVCDGCHDIIHFCDDGSKRPETEQDAILQAGQRQTDYPEPVVDLRRPMARSKPRLWHRMTAVQRSLWLTRYQELAAAKRGVALARALAAQERRKPMAS